MLTYTKYLNPTVPQSEPLNDRQVQNSAGGYSFQVDDWARLNRFLILGTEGGSFYAGERKLTMDNLSVVERCIAADGPRTVTAIVQVSDEGRAPKNDPAIIALAIALKKGDEKTRRMAASVVPLVCRIGTHLFALAEAVKNLGGWGRVTKRAFTEWYGDSDHNRLAMNLVKYQSRNGWAHRDLLRKAKPVPADEVHRVMYRWAVGKPLTNAELSSAPAIIRGFELAKRATSAKEIVALIEEFNLPRECIPTEHLANAAKVWEALLMTGRGMPLTAMVRNLGKMTTEGVLDSFSAGEQFVIKRLTDADALKRARVHPIALLQALGVYKSGGGVRGSLSWDANPRIIDALDEAFYLAFGSIEPTGKRHMLALDVSGSMAWGKIAGMSITPREAAAAMALVAARTEPKHSIMAFGHEFVPVNISQRQRLDDVIEATGRLGMSGTDCALPMLYAMEKNIDVDAFVVYTDSETRAGYVHPAKALEQYRQKTGVNAKLIVVGMESNGFSIADPNDPGMLDVVGFDTSTPAALSAFVAQ